LRIKDFAGHEIDGLVNDLQILSSRMEYPGRTSNSLPKCFGAIVTPGIQAHRISTIDFSVRRDLNQAKLREERLLAYEFSVNTDTRLQGESHPETVVRLQVDKLILRHEVIWKGLRLR
jgi:hypothetical protein